MNLFLIFRPWGSAHPVPGQRCHLVRHGEVPTRTNAQEGRKSQASIRDPQRHQGPQVVRLGTLLHQEDQQPEGGGGPPVEDLPVPGGDAELRVEQRPAAGGFGLLRDIRPH